MATRKWSDILISCVGGVIEARHDSQTTSSSYETLRVGARVVTLRYADHGNWGNPRQGNKFSACAAGDARAIEMRGHGGPRALALWLGFSADDLRAAARAGSPGTIKWATSLASIR